MLPTSLLRTPTIQPFKSTFSALARRFTKSKTQYCGWKSEHFRMGSFFASGHHQQWRWEDKQLKKTTGRNREKSKAELTQQKGGDKTAIGTFDATIRYTRLPE